MIQLEPFMKIGTNISNILKTEKEVVIKPYKDEDIYYQVNKYFNNLKNNLTFRAFVHLTTEGLNVSDVITEMRAAESISDYQNAFIKVVRGMDKKSNTNVIPEGLKNIDKDKNYLIMTTHNNIFMNPYHTSLAIMDYGLDGPFSVAGENLAKVEFVDNLFKPVGTILVVRNNPTAVQTREFSGALRDARKKIPNGNKSTWMAQYPGRPKDNYNITAPEIIRMIALAQKTDGKTMNDVFNDYILPAPLSYQYEPCDVLMAQELVETELRNGYDKGRFEDAISIYKGIVGEKGNVYVTFGKPLQGDFSNNTKIGAKQIAKAIDEQIISNYHIHDTNEYAYNMLTKTEKEMKDVPNPFGDRFKGVSPNVKSKVYKYYANPIIQKKQLEGIVEF